METGGDGLRKPAQVPHQKSSSLGFYGQQDGSQRADGTGQSKGTERLDHRPGHQHLEDTQRQVRRGSPEGTTQGGEDTWAMNGAIIPPMRLKEVQKPIPRERATVGYT